MEPDADVRAPGAAVAVALCGHWDYEPPCPMAPHRVGADWIDGELRVRVLFATEPDKEQEVRRLIDRGLAGQLTFPDDFTTPWRVRESRPSAVSADEAGPAEYLIRH